MQRRGGREMGKTWDENENDEGIVNWTTLQEFTSRFSYDI